MALHLDQLSRRGEDEVDIDIPALTLETGRTMSIVGRDPVGPSLLVRLIGGLETPTSGRITLEDRPLGASDDGLAYLRLPEMAHLLEAWRAPGSRPSIVLLEACTDTSGCREALALVRQLGLTTVCALVDADLALDCSDQIAVLDGGRLIQAGPPAELLGRPANVDVAGLFKTPPMNIVRGILEKDGCAVQIGPRSLQLNGEIAEIFCRDIFLGVRPEHIRVRRGEGVGWPGQVVAVHDRDGGVWIDVAVDGARLVALDGAGLSLAPGDDVGLSVSPEHLLVFDDRGDRLEIR